MRLMMKLAATAALFSIAATNLEVTATAQTNFPARAVGETLDFLNNLNSLAGVLDGSGDMPPGTITRLEDQIAALEAETYGPMMYSLEDYALSVGAIVGDGEGVIAEIDGVLTLLEERRTELVSLTARDATLAQIETQYAIADRAVTDGMAVLEDYLENGGMAADQISGYPIFNNWQVLHNEIAPRFSDRLSEVRRVRKEIGVYRQHLYRHVEDATKSLEGFKEHVRRIREFREAQSVQQADDTNTAFLQTMKAREERIQAALSDIRTGNAATREEVRRIQEAQANAMSQANVINSIVKVVQAGLSVYGAAAATSAPQPSINVTVRSVTTSVPTPVSPPLKPIDGVPIGGSGL